MLAPRLIPEITRSGSQSRSPVTARCTQSVGVPLTNRKPLGARRTVSGRSRVSEFDAPLRSRSGATTVISAWGARSAARRSRPGAKYPSSLESRMRIIVASALTGEDRRIITASHTKRPPRTSRSEVPGHTGMRPQQKPLQTDQRSGAIRGRRSARRCVVRLARESSGRPVSCEHLGELGLRFDPLQQREELRTLRLEVLARARPLGNDGGVHIERAGLRTGQPWPSRKQVGEYLPVPVQPRA